MKEKLKNTLSFLLRLGLSAGLLIFVFSKIDLAKTTDVIKSAEGLYLGWAAILFVIVNCLLLVRWFVMIRALDLETTVKNVVLHYFYGLFGNLFLPTSIGGDILKAVGLCKSSSQKPKVVASIVIDRLSGFTGISIVALCAFVFGYRYIGDNSLILPIALMAGGSLTIATVLLIEPVYAFFCKVFDWWPKLKNSLMSMHYDIALLKESHKSVEGFKAILLSMTAQFVFLCSFYFVAKALHQNIAFIYFLIFVPIISVVSSFPSIGGLGVREVGAIYLFGKIGIESGIAASLTLINFLFMIAIGLVGGLLYVYTIFTGRVQHRSSAAGVETGHA